MNNFVYKSLYISILVLVVFQLTLAKPVKKFTRLVNKLDNFSEIEQFKENFESKLRVELQRSLERDEIFNYEDKELIKNFIEKLLAELDLKVN